MKINFWIVIVAFAMLLTGCVENKKTGKMPAFGKAYHNLTGHYNYFFNARELIARSKIKLDEAHKDNYNKVLEMYRFAAVQSAQTEYAALDDGIKRATINVSLHRKSLWADDSYLQIGMAQYLKKEYKDAEATFGFMINEYDPKKIPKTKRQLARAAKAAAAAKKKPSAQKKPTPKPTPKTTQKTDPKNPNKAVVSTDETPRDANGKKIRRRTYFLQHRPVREDAMIWLARTYIEQERFDEADGMIRRLKSDFTLPRKLFKQLFALESYSLLRQKNYPAAIASLEKTLKNTHGMADRTRYTYILAQLYDLQHDPDKALASYKKVLKLDPSFDMEFNARLNMANNAFASGKMKSIEVVALLKKMLREAKYDEHYDQIYYTLGKISLGNGEVAEGIDYFKKSVRANKSDKNQRAESYYTIAELYWKAEKYALAKRYYDSTETTLAKTDDRYDTVHRRAFELADIAKNIDLVVLNDSLLRVALMPEVERDALGRKIIEAQRATAKASAIAEAVAAANLDAESRVSSQDDKNGAIPRSAAALNLGDGSATKFWAYDEGMRRKGKLDFDRKWGKRKRTDDWRRAARKDDGNNAEATDPNNPNATNPTADPSNLATNGIDQAEIDAFFAGIPKTEAARDTLRAQNAEALYKIGDLFRLRMSMPPLSIRAHEDLLSRKPIPSPHEQEVFYTLYLNYTDLNNLAKAAYYKKMLLDKHPNSLFAKVVSDPTYLAKERKKAEVLDTYYENAFRLYKKDSTLAALTLTMRSDSAFGKDNKLKAKFALLAAQCRGNLNGKDDYIIALKNVQLKYANTPEAARATEILAQLQNTAKPKNETQIGSNPLAAATYAYKADTEHYVVVWIKDEGATERLTDYRTSAGNYNKRYFENKNLKIAALTPDLKTALLIVRRFDDAATAQAYARMINGKANEFFGESKVTYSALPMSATNYTVFLRTKDFDGYETFYAANYK